MDDSVIFIKKFILRKLVNLGKIGGSHTVVFNLSKGLPENIRSNKKGQKAIKEAIKELINEGFLLAKQSTGEQHVSVNPRKIKEIKE
ncbi:MAG: hypothetical protein HYW50_00135, partial [Candidatus Diapherotrites archaeon]|nr:hypothetical protein [Candidatus Diapherotrites archaeon]